MQQSANPGFAVLNDMYWGKLMTQHEMGEQLGVNWKTIVRWMKIEGIPTRPRGKIAQVNPEKLGRPPKRAAVIPQGRAIDRLTEPDRLLVLANVRNFLIYAAWKKEKR